MLIIRTIPEKTWETKKVKMEAETLKRVNPVKPVEKVKKVKKVNKPVSNP